MNMTNIVRMVLCHPFFLLFNIFVFNFNVYSQPIPKELVSAFQKTSELKLSESEILLSKTSINHPFKMLIQDYNDVLDLIIDEDYSSFEQLENKMDDRLQKLENITDKSSPWYRLIKAEIKFHWGIVNFKFNNQITAAWQINQAHSLIKENQKKFPNFSPNLKTMGIFHIVIGAMPDNYQWILEKLGFEGNINLGLQELEKCIAAKNIFSSEADIILTYIKAHLLNNYDVSIKIFESKYAKNKSLPYHYILTSLYTNTHQAEKAIELINNKPKSKVYPNFYFYRYKLGNCYFQKGEYEKAINELTFFIEKYKGKNYIKGSYHKIALAYYFLNNEKEQMKAYQAIDENGWELLDEDKYAQEFYKKGKWPNRYLAKSRYYSDGGYFDKALFELNGKKFNTEEENIEMNYRLGRIHDLKKNYDKAIEYYSLASNNENNSNSYYAPNACLKAAIIYLNNNNKTEAKKLLHKSIAYKNHAYENSIEMKAKSLLKTLEN